MSTDLKMMIDILLLKIFLYISCFPHCSADGSHLLYLLKLLQLRLFHDVKHYVLSGSNERCSIHMILR